MERHDPMAYVKCADIAGFLGIEKGGVLHVSSNISALLVSCMRNGEAFEPSLLVGSFIDSLIGAVGCEGTLIFPTYNWGFCSGKTFDYRETPCGTGALAASALKRKDFKRTRHPIYSFAVWGKDQDLLAGMDNEKSFGSDSPFGYMYRQRAKNLLIGVDLSVYTFVHFVEEQTGGIPYRYQKYFTADYIDEDGVLSRRTYSMLVRDLDMDVRMAINPFEEPFLSAGAMTRKKINAVDFRMVDMRASFDIIQDDILNNRSRKICSYIGQED
jgi:aminoglycoside 3-N-acetyltransferase